jgi:hypothetical protein
MRYNDNVKTIHRYVLSVRRKLLMHALLTAFTRGAFLGGVALCAAIALQRLLVPGFPLLWIAIVLLGTAIVLPVILSVLRRPSALQAAIFADLHNDLHERISSALVSEKEHHPFRDRLVADAVAAIPRANRPIPFRTPLEAKLMFAPVATALLLFLLLPEMDLLHLADKARQETAAKDRVRRSANRLLRKARRLSTEAKGLELEEGLAMAKDLERFSEKVKREELTPKEAMVELTRLSEMIRRSGRSKNYEPVKDAFRRRPGREVEPQSLSEKVLRAMEKGSPSDAVRKLQKEMERIREQMQDKGISAEEKKKLARQLRRLTQDFKIPPDIAKKLQKLAKALEKMAREQGKKPSDKYEGLAPDMEDLLKALEELSKRMDEKDFLKKLLKQIENTRDGLSGQGQGGQPMPIPLPGEGKNPSGKGGGDDQGEDTGGSAQGKGSDPGESDDPDTEFKTTISKGKFDRSGKIVGVSTFKGLPKGGEARSEYSKLFSEFEKRAEDSLAKEKIPVKYKDYIRRYFDSIRPRRGGKDG